MLRQLRNFLQGCHIVGGRDSRVAPGPGVHHQGSERNDAVGRVVSAEAGGGIEGTTMTTAQSGQV